MKAIYLTLKQYTLQKMAVKHVGLWNDQLSNIEDEISFERPAIFIELGEVQWTNVNKNGKRGTLPITLHLVTDCHDVYAGDSSALDSLDLMDNVADKFDGLKIELCTPFIPSATAVDNNHGNLIHNQVSYTTEVTKCIKYGKNYTEATPELNVTGTFDN